MNKLVWQDYWKGFSWSNIKAYFHRNKMSALSVVFVGIALLPQAESMGVGSVLETIARAIGCGLPTLFLFWSLALTDMMLPKVLYMAPLTEEERKEYVEKKWRLAVLVPNLFNLVWILLGVVCGVDAISLVFLTLHFWIMSEGAIFYRNKHSDRFELALGKAFSVYTVFCAMIAMLVQIIASVVLVEDGTIGVAWLGTFLGVILLLELPLLIKLMTYKKKLITCMMNYEELLIEVSRQEG